MTIEGDWADRPDEDVVIDEDNRRYAPLAMMLRARYAGRRRLLDRGHAGSRSSPSQVVAALRAKLAE